MREAAEALRLTAQNLHELGVCDHIIPEPLGGAHRNVPDTVQAVGDTIRRLLGELTAQSREDLVSNRRKKYLALGTTGLAV